MKATCDLHMHTTWCDGADTPAAMVRAALDRGLARVGCSGHSYTFFDESYCMPRGAEGYRAEMRALREQYAGRIEVLCGVEQDYYSAEPTADYDYVIGSVHYVRQGDDYLPVDESPALLTAAAERFGGWYELAEAYFATVADVVDRTDCDIIGHFDLIAKFNEGGRLFDERHPRYAAAWQSAAERLLRTGRPFEINTGAITRGYRTQPYPDLNMLAWLRARGAKLLLSSDSHSAKTLCARFDEYEHWATQDGIAPRRG